MVTRMESVRKGSRKKAWDNLKREVRACVNRHACPGCGFGAKTTRDIMLLFDQWIENR